VIGLLALWANPLVRYGVAIAGVLAGLGGLYGWAHHNGALSEREAWQTAIAAQKADAAKMIADRVAENARQEAVSEALNAKLSKEVADAHAQTDDALVAYNRAVADRVRLSRSRPSCATPPAAETPSPGGNPQLDPAGIWISGDAAIALGAKSAAADDTQAVMSACKSWALEHGR
jgi:hypothetical protein